MRKTGIILLIMMVFLCTAGLASAEQEKTLLTIYEGPKTMESSRTASVSVNGYELPCILAEVSDSNPWYMMQFALVRTCFVSENWLVVMEAAADTPEAALEALRHIFWL